MLKYGKKKNDDDDDDLLGTMIGTAATIAIGSWLLGD